MMTKTRTTKSRKLIKELESRVKHWQEREQSQRDYREEWLRSRYALREATVSLEIARRIFRRGE